MRWVSLCCATILASAVVAVREARAETFRSEEFGLEVEVPEGWRRIPAGDHRRTGIVVRFECGEDVITPATKLNIAMRPTLEIRRVVRRSADAVGSRSHLPVSDKSLGVHLREVAEASGEFESSSDDEARVGTEAGRHWRVLWFQQRIDMVTHGWEISSRQDRCALFAHVPLRHEDTFRKVLERAVSTLRFFPPKTPRSTLPARPDASSDLTQAEMRELRESSSRAVIEKLRKDLVGQWSEVEGEHFTAFSSVDEERTRDVIESAERVREWLDAKLSYVGSGYVGRAVIVLFDNAQALSYITAPDKPASNVPLVPTWVSGVHEDPELAKRVRNAWFQDRSPDMRTSLPGWFDTGLDELLAASSLSRGRAKLESREERTTWKRINGEATRIGAREFFSLRRQAIADSEDVRWQSGRFLHFLTDGPGSRASLTKGLLERYVKHAIVFRTEQEDRRASSGGKALPATETEALREIFDRTFADWKEADWRRFEASWEKACR